MHYLVKRGSFPGTFDYGLKEQAVKSGVTIHFEKTIPANKADIVATGPIIKAIPGIVKGIVFNTDLKDMSVSVYNDRLAFKGYSYFTVRDGYGCICSVVIDELDRINDCFEKTKEFFVKKFNQDIKSPKMVGGVGCFSLNNTFRKGNTLYVGESAGLQDFAAGFGMRYAFKSGHLAAQSIINNKDYEPIAEKMFRNQMKASLVVRYVYERLIPKDNYSFLIELMYFLSKYKLSPNRYTLVHRMLYPFAQSFFREKYPKLGACDV